VSRATRRATREAERGAAEVYALDFPCPRCRARQGQRCKPLDDDLSNNPVHLARLDLGGVKARKVEQRARHRTMGIGGRR
jgi:hypothetical protein